LSKTKVVILVLTSRATSPSGTKGQTMHTTETHAVEMLVTDTVCYDIIKQTAQTITLRRCYAGEKTHGEFPVIYKAVVSDPSGETKTLRLRKDGSFRLYNGGNRIWFTSEPAFRTDYSF